MIFTKRNHLWQEIYIFYENVQWAYIYNLVPGANFLAIYYTIYPNDLPELVIYSSIWYGMISVLG